MTAFRVIASGVYAIQYEALPTIVHSEVYAGVPLSPGDSAQP